MFWLRNKKINFLLHTLNLIPVTLCQLGKFFMISQNQLFRKNSFRNTIRVLNSLDRDEARHFIGPDLGSNCFYRLSADDTSRQRVTSK